MYVYTHACAELKGKVSSLIVVLVKKKKSVTVLRVAGESNFTLGAFGSFYITVSGSSPSTKGGRCFSFFTSLPCVPARPFSVARLSYQLWSALWSCA